MLAFTFGLLAPPRSHRRKIESPKPSYLEGDAAVKGGALRVIETHDYHLVKGAEPIDAGETLTEVQTDLDNGSRPSGKAYDIGAYEYGAEINNDTGDTSNPDTGSPDTADSGIIDDTPKQSAGDKAGELGGCSCASSSSPTLLRAATLGTLIGGLLLGRRRR